MSKITIESDTWNAESLARALDIAKEHMRLLDPADITEREWEDIEYWDQLSPYLETPPLH
jgi:hypothetical protein